MTTDATPKCQYCGQPWHKTICPLISAIEYDITKTGVVRRVEFHKREPVGSTLTQVEVRMLNQVGHDAIISSCMTRGNCKKIDGCSLICERYTKDFLNG